MSSKREHLISTGAKLFSRYGLHRVTVDQICQHAETSRVTFYKHFSNKESLVIAWLARLISKTEALFDQLAQQEISFNHKVERLIEHKLKQNAQLAEGFIQDLLQSPTPAVAAYLEQQSRHMQQRLARFYDQGRAEGAIHPEISNQMIYYLHDQLEKMLCDPRLQQLQPNQELRHRHLIHFFFNGIGQHD